MIAVAAGEDKHYLVEYLHIDNADWLTLTDIQEIAQRYRTATQYAHIFIDLSFLQNDEDAVLDALSVLYAINPANLILLAFNYEPGNHFLVCTRQEQREQQPHRAPDMERGVGITPCNGFYMLFPLATGKPLQFKLLWSQ